MRFLRYLALLGLLIVPAAYSHAQVSVGVGVGPAYGGGYYAPPVCQWGYYGYAPYACAPYGYYGPTWFNSGLFIGAGPWFRGGYGYRGYGYRAGYYGGYRGGYRGGYAGRGYVGGRGVVGGGFHGNVGRGGGGGFHGGGGGGFHGGGGHGGGHR